MARSSALPEFVMSALQAGRSRDEIRDALLAAGWTGDEVQAALDAWADMAFSPPVPRPTALISARDFFVYALTFGLMLFSAGYLIALLFDVIDIYLRDGDSAPRYRFDAIRFKLALLIVTVPFFAVLTLRDRSRLRAEPGRRRSAIRKWLTAVTLLLAAALLLGDLVAVIHAFLSGDLTAQFFAKAGVVAVVAGGAFLFYRADLDGEEAR